MRASSVPVFKPLHVECARFPVQSPFLFPVCRVRRCSGKSVHDRKWQRHAARGIVWAGNILLTTGSGASAAGADEAVIPANRNPNDDMLGMPPGFVCQPDVYKCGEACNFSQTVPIDPGIIATDGLNVQFLTGETLVKRLLQPAGAGPALDIRRRGEHGSVIKKNIVPFLQVHSSPKRTASSTQPESGVRLPSPKP